MAVNETVLCGVIFQRFNPRPSFFDWQAFQMRCMGTHEQCPAPGVRMDARQGVVHGGRVVDFCFAKRALPVFAGQLPAMNDFHVGQF